MAKIVAVCRSDKKGTRKIPIKEGILKEEYGLDSDAHASSEWHRQVSLLSVASIDKMKAMGLKVGYGDFAENLTVEGMLVYELPVGTKLKVGKGILLEVTQIGKECHTRCAIYKQVGTCVMPQEGVFARVLKGGKVSAGDKIEVAKS